MALLVAFAAAGCAGGEEAASEAQRRSTPSPTTTTGPSKAPVAYQLRRGDALKLAGTDAWRMIERKGRTVARSEWDGYLAIVLSEWLDERGIRLDVPRDLRPVMQSLADEQELTLLVVSSEHQRYADALARLHPTERELRSFHERFTDDDSTDAGRAMLDWLRVFRLAIGNTDARHVVVIRLLD